MPKRRPYKLELIQLKILDKTAMQGSALAVQEFAILPVGVAASTETEAIKMDYKVYHKLMFTIKEKCGKDACNVGHKGGCAPSIRTITKGLSSANQ